MKNSKDAAAASESKSLRRKKEGMVVPRLEKAQGVNEQHACGYSFLRGKARAASFPFTGM